ncbi:kinase-like domain, phloem protein 2-like protein [Tanacetum coccineum]
MSSPNKPIGLAKGSLDKWLKCKEPTWRKRLGICVNIARGLNFLHGTSDVKHDVVIHRDIKSANILLHDDWKASIADFGLSLISPINRDINYVINKEKWDDLLSISLDYIKLATQYFSHDNLIGKGDFWSVYKGEVTSADGCEIIAVKRFDRMSNQRETERMADIEVLSNYAHENIISLFGYCYEKGERIFVYQYPSISKGSLDRWLKHDGHTLQTITWRKRLEICIDITRGLVFLHGTSGAKQEVVIHGDIKSTNVLLHGDWKSKIAYFGCSLISPMNPELKYVVNNAKGTPGYCDPLYKTTGVLTKESDIYSFGVLLLEMLYGRLVMEHDSSNRAQNLVRMCRYEFLLGNVYEIMFQAVRKQGYYRSLTTFQDIAYKCVSEFLAERPTASDVLIQLIKALEFQWFSLWTDGRRVEVISAAEFHFKSYFGPDKWIPTPESRFGQVAWIADSSMMYMQFKIKARLLSPGINYGVNLLFKFCALRKNLDTSIDLEYHIGNKFLRSHCTTERDGGWLMKELFQFSSLAEEADIDVFLLGFLESHYMTHEETEELKRVSMANVQQSITEEGHWKVNMAEVQELPADKGGHVFGILLWLLEKCCG